MYLNKAIIIGNLTRDPELKSLPSGMQVTSFSLATNRVWKDKNGAKQESTDYHNIVVFGRQAETANQYLKKGASVLVEGRIQTRSWDGQDGKKQYRTEIVADRVQFGPRPTGAAGGAGFTPGAGASSSGSSSGVTSSGEQPMPDEGIAYPDDEINPEDIPF
ncbi:MAG: single-stranded DNA-binding protein [Chloroflexota bacterium]